MPFAPEARLPAAPGGMSCPVADWDACVERLLGPRLAGEAKEGRERLALELAAAALRFAGEGVLAANLLDET